MSMFGKGKQADSPDLLNADVVHELQVAAKKKFSGVVEVTDRATNQVASLFVYEGGLYSVALPGYIPSVPDRLRAAGTITGDQAKLLTVPGSDWPSPLAGPVAVEQSWLTADALAALHQEYLVAGLGAVTALEKVKIRLRKGESTKDFCTMPLPVEPLFDALRMRAGRLAAGWAAITAEGTPSTVALESRQVAPPADMTLPEFISLTAAVDGRTSLDEVAYGLGLTRAEAVHMSMLLVRAGVLHVSATPAVLRRSDRLLVPEAFGQYVPGPAVASAAVVVAPAAPEPTAAPQATAPTGSPLLATSAVFAAGQALDQPESASPDTSDAETAVMAPVAPKVAPEPVVFAPVEPAPVAPGSGGGDDSAPGWAAALLAAEAVSHASDPEPDEVESASAPPPVKAVVVAPLVVEPDPIPVDPAFPPVPPVPAPKTPGISLVAAPAEPAPTSPPPSRTPRTDEHVLLLRREMAMSEVAELEQLLAKVTAEETDAIARASSVRARLNSAISAVSRVDDELAGGASSST